MRGKQIHALIGCRGLMTCSATVGSRGRTDRASVLKTTCFIAVQVVAQVIAKFVKLTGVGRGGVKIQLKAQKLQDPWS